MATANASLLVLPAEVLSKVISYLGTDDKLRASKVCRIFKDLSYHPSMWKIEEITIRTSHELNHFCSLYSSLPYLRKLSLSFSTGRESLTKQETFSLNEVFRKSERLTWLHLEQINLDHIILPDNLRHLKYVYDSYSVEQISSIDKCLFLEHLHLVDKAPLVTKDSNFSRFKEAFGTFLMNHRDSLQSLYLNITPIPREWMDLISRCPKLKLLGVTASSIPEEPGVCNHYFSNFAKLANLETIFLESWFDFTYNENSIVLPNVKHLFINTVSRNLRGKDFQFILKTFPRLKTIFLSKADSEEVFDFVKKCKTLKHIGIGNSFSYEYLEKLLDLHKERQYSSICLCELIKFRIPDSTYDIMMKATFPKEKCCFHFLNPFQELIWDDSKVFSYDYSKYRDIQFLFTKLKELYLF